MGSGGADLRQRLAGGAARKRFSLRMTRWFDFPRRSGRFNRTSAATVVALAAVLSAGACMSPGDGLEVAGASVPDTPANTEYRLAARQAAWSAQPGVVLVMQRTTTAGRQQVIGLANDTASEGDNYLALIAYGANDAVPKRFDLQTALGRINGVPKPFGTLSDSDLLQRRDALGTYLVAERSVGGGATCVLAIRRLGVASRMLPPGTAAMEVILRNCATGSAATAMAPFRPERLAINLAAANVDGGVQPRVINPLAAPEQ